MTEVTSSTFVLLSLSVGSLSERTSLWYKECDIALVAQACHWKCKGGSRLNQVEGEVTRVSES